MIDKLPLQNRMPQLDIAIAAALKAGKAVMEIYSNEFTVKTKEDDSPVTAADIKSNEIIKDALAESKHWILSEEDKDDLKRLEQEYVWIIDPLDGTTDFVKRTGEFTIMIALVKKSTPILGVIYWPTTDTLFVAQKNSGAFKYSNNSWQQIHVTSYDLLKDCRAVASKNHLSGEEKRMFEKLDIKELTTIGSSLKVAKISNGHAEIYITTTDKMKEWDSCASYCLVTEAGGQMTDLLGNDLKYNNLVVNHQNGIVATNGAIHDIVIKNIRDLE